MRRYDVGMGHGRVSRADSRMKSESRRTAYGNSSHVYVLMSSRRKTPECAAWCGGSLHTPIQLCR